MRAKPWRTTRSPPAAPRTDLLFDSDGGSLPTTGGITTIGTAIGTGATTATDTDAHSVILPVDSGISSCIISASNYDQTCTVDTDCELVPTGNFCVPVECECTGIISLSVLPTYTADIEATPIGQNAFGIECGCGHTDERLCCRQGQCTSQCAAAPSDTLAACATAGGTCRYAPAGLPQCPSGVTSGVVLPASTTNPPCAYADEACCVSVVDPR